VDCTAEHLLQFAVLGSALVSALNNEENPSVGLLNIGEEVIKGSEVIKKAGELLRSAANSGDLNFYGNVEGNDIFKGTTDIVVCDGFVGNIVLKQAESLYFLLRKRNISDPFIDRFNYENIGGTPIVGINANVVIGHGISKRKAIMNMVLQTKAVVSANLARKILEAI